MLLYYGIAGSDKGTREAKHPPAQHPQGCFCSAYNIQLRFQHVLRFDKYDVLHREEAPWLGQVAPAQVVISWEAKEEGEGFAGARRDVNVNKSSHVISFPALQSLPACLSLS